MDHRLDSWPAPIIVSIADNWVGELPAVPVVMAGRGPSLPGLKLRDAADALPYLEPQKSLATVPMPRSELEGRPYGKEPKRRVPPDDARTLDCFDSCDSSQQPRNICTQERTLTSGGSGRTCPMRVSGNLPVSARR